MELDDPRLQPERERWGDLVVSVELGYASGDADPNDGVTRRFTFDQNHNVGLVLFDHVLAYKTARAATIAADPNIVHRASPGLQFLPSEGGVFGAAYLYPTVVVRPASWVDLKAGMVIAQTTADLVDPFHYGALGDYANYFVTLAILLFAYSTMLTWSYYGDRSVGYLVGNTGVTVYRWVFTGFVVLGAVTRLNIVWNFSSIMNCLMAVPNLVALIGLSALVAREKTSYFAGLLDQESVDSSRP